MIVTRPIGVKHRIFATLAIAGPGALVLLGLAAADRLDWPIALVASFVIIVGAAIVASIHLARLDRVRRLVRRLAEAERQAPEEVAAESLLARDFLISLEPAVAEAEERLRRREAVFATRVARTDTVLASLPDPLILLNRDGRLMRLNTAAEELFGQHKEGRHLTDILRHPGLLAAAEAACRSGKGGQVEFTLPGPVERFFHARVTSLSGEDEPAAVMTLHDITAIRRAESLRGDFVANASHELRTPLASLVGFIETLRGPARDDPEAQDRFLSIMQEQAGRMARLIEDLLSLSRIELDEHTPPSGRVDLAQVLLRVAGALEVQARKKKMHITIDADNLPPVTGNEDELTQLFQNLIDNAVKYGRPESEVRVIARPTRIQIQGAGGGEAEGVNISVIDEGEGIAREDIPRLTERFYRVDKARSRALGGTGLGLAIVKHIVNRHRGRLSVESILGKGSSFVVQLPAASGRAAPAGERAPKDQSAAE